VRLGSILIRNQVGIYPIIVNARTGLFPQNLMPLKYCTTIMEQLAMLHKRWNDWISRY